MPYTFVFSYARDDQDPYLVKFYEDLDRAVARRAGLPKGVSAGFFDQTEIQLGHHWPSELAVALATSPVLVMLYSPIYFSKFYCGKEVQVFLERTDAAPTGALLPILWLPVRQVPPALQHLQYTHSSLGDVYAARGLQHLRTLKRYRDSYNGLVLEVADRIVKCLERPLPSLATTPDIFVTRNAFEASAVASTAARSSVTGPASVSFIYVTARPSDSRTWAPYPPPENQIWKLSFDIARAHEMVPQVMPLDGQLLHKLKVAAAQNEVVVLLVDSNSLAVEPYRTRMQEYDVCNYINCAALIVWPQDLSVSNKNSIDLLINKAFPNSESRQQIWFHRAITSLDELRAALTVTLKKLQAEIISRASDPAAPESRELPIIG